MDAGGPTLRSRSGMTSPVGWVQPIKYALKFLNSTQVCFQVGLLRKRVECRTGEVIHSRCRVVRLLFIPADWNKHA